MRVLQLHTRYRQPGGEDALVAAEASMLRAAGHEVQALTAQNPAGARAGLSALARSSWNPAARRGAERAARDLRPDVAHVHNTWYAMSPSVLAGLSAAGVPVVTTLHNYRLACANALLYRDGAPCTDCVGASPWQGVRHRCYRGSVLQSAAAASSIALHGGSGTWAAHVQVFLALTEFARSTFVAAGLPSSAILVRPNATADPGPRRVPPSASRTVLWVGRLVPEKGVDTLLEAWRHRSRHPDPDRDLELVIVGDGPQRAVLERAAPPGVRLIGAQPPERVRDLLLAARALVFPSRWYEGQPMAVLEAFAAGLPVLAADLGGLGETVAPLGRRWLLPPGDAAAWARGLGRLSDDAELDAAGVRARGVYEQRHTPQGAVASLEHAYAEAIERSHAGVRRSADPVRPR